MWSCEGRQLRLWRLKVINLADEISVVIGKKTIVYVILAVVFFAAGFSTRTVIGGNGWSAQMVEDKPAAPSGTASVQSSAGADSDPWIGGENAEVEIVEFSDFECSFCSRAVSTVKQILSEYGDRVRIVYRDFPLGFHANAQKAAEAAECADEQGRFWEYHDKLFENQRSLGVANLKRYASELGLDTPAFDECLDSNAMADEVKADFADGQAAGVSGTPTFFVNGNIVVGAQPFEAFKQIIDQELGESV